MTHGQLFGGIAGFGLAAQWAGITNTWYNEIDPYCCDVVRARIEDGSFKDKFQVIEGDIRNIGKHNLKPVDIISGGFPCQPFSVAGKRKGKADDRYLWPEMLRVIQELKPAFVVGENVPNLINLGLDECLADLENEGYTTEQFIIPASAVGAWHQRDRIWIVAYSKCTNGQLYRKSPCGKLELEQNTLPEKRWLQGSNSANGLGKDVSDTNGQRLPKPTRAGVGSIQEQTKSFQRSEPGRTTTKGWDYWQTEPNVGRVADGIPRRMDRIKALGNAIVPQAALPFFKAIKRYDTQFKTRNYES